MVKGTLARSHTLQASHFMGPLSRVLCSPVPSECEWQVGEKVSMSNKEESGRVRNPMDLKSDVGPFDTASVSQRCIKINRETTAGQLPLRQLTINCPGDCLQCQDRWGRARASYIEASALHGLQPQESLFQTVKRFNKRVTV